MKGYRTVAFGFLLALLPAGLTYLGGVDWTSLGISASMGAIIGGLVVFLRTITSTPMGKAAP